LSSFRFIFERFFVDFIDLRFSKIFSFVSDDEEGEEEEGEGEEEEGE